jgi:hypothetical protein
VRHVAVEHVVRRGLVGDDVGDDALGDHAREDLGRVPDEADRQAALGRLRLADPPHRLLEVGVMRSQYPVSRRFSMRDGIDIDPEDRGIVHRRRERLRAAHAAEAGGEDEASRERAAEVLPRDRAEGLVRALHDALRADVDPRARGHLAVHHEALPLELAEVLPGGEAADEVAVGDEHARRVRMRAEDGDGLAALDEQRLVVLERRAASARWHRRPASRARPCRSPP